MLVVACSVFKWVAQNFKYFWSPEIQPQGVHLACLFLSLLLTVCLWVVLSLLNQVLAKMT